MRLYPVKRPLCVAILAFIIGLWIGNILPLSLRWCFCIALGSLCVGAFCTYRYKSCRFFVYGMALLIGFFMIQSQTLTHQTLMPYHDTSADIKVTITRAPHDRTYADGEAHTINGKPLSQPVHLRIKRSYNDTTNYLPYTTYQFTGRLLAPQPQTNPGGYNEKKQLAQRGIFSVLKADASGIQKADAPWWAQQIHHLKEKSLHLLSQTLTEDEQALVWATLFGDVSFLNDDFYTLSQKFGIIHIFSVSGLHVGFIVAFIYLLARAVRRQHSWAFFILLTLLLTLYALLSDASAPAVRASIMAVIALFSLRLHRYHDPLTIISLAALALLISTPYNLWQIGFQLSFIAMLGIVLLAPAFSRLLGFLPSTLADTIAMALAAECAALPFVAWYFYMVAPLSLLMNLLVVPLFSALVPLSLLALLLTACCPTLAPLFFLPTKILIHAIIALMSLVTTTIGTMHRYIGQPPWALLGLYVLLLFAIVLSQHTKRRLYFSGLLALCILIICLRPATSASCRLSVLDVGQGSGAAYQTANRDWLIFDTGLGVDTMAQYLRYAGVRRVSAIILSHSDADHIGGTAHILRDFQVDNILVSKEAQKSSEWQALSPYLKNISVHTITDDTTFQLEKDVTLKLTLLHADTSIENNSNQVVALLSERQHRYLIPGDTGGEYLKDLPWDTSADVVLVPHHGSKNSWQPSFYQRFTPQLAIISCGRHNRFGHPHQEVTQGLESLNIPYYSTHQHGAIQIYEKNDTLYVEPFA